MWDDLAIPDNETEAVIVCQSANTDETTCTTETYLSGGLSTSCVWTSESIGGGTCIGTEPLDEGAANSTCNEASSSFDACLAARYDADDADVSSLSCTTVTDVASARESCRVQIEQALEDLPLQVLRDVDVREVTPLNLFGEDYAFDTMKFDVHFVENSGDLPNLQSLGRSDLDADVLIVEKVKGTTENAYCSNRGICDHGTGLCKCFQGFTKHDCSKQNALAMY